MAVTPESCSQTCEQTSRRAHKILKLTIFFPLSFYRSLTVVDSARFFSEAEKEFCAAREKRDKWSHIFFQ